MSLFWTARPPRTPTRGAAATGGGAKPRTPAPRAYPPIPDTGWWRPEGMPSLASAKVIAIDTETRDDTLDELGPGVRRGAYIVGVSIATDDGFRGYYPIAHEGAGEKNFNREWLLSALRTELGRPGQVKLGANILYDLDMLAEAGVPVEGPIRDVQLTEALIDENQLSYSLDDIAERRIGRNKVEGALVEWSKRAFGCKTIKAVKQNIWRTPVELVGPYAEGDVVLPLEIDARQRAIIAHEDATRREGVASLASLAELEYSLVPMLLAMRRRGIRVDFEAAQRASERFKGELEATLNEIKRLSGYRPDIWAADSLAKLFGMIGIQYNMTGGANPRPSFTKPFLKNHSHPVAQLVMKARGLAKVDSTFIEGYIIRHSINGRIHCSFHQLRGEGGGAVSGRFSSSDPNLQNIPTRDKVLGPVCREMFVADHGEVYIMRDWSQIEYRLIVHYAALMGLPKAEETVRMYREDPDTDFHAVVAQMSGLERSDAKNLNFGIAYGEGAGKIANDLGRSLTEAKEIILKHATNAPFIRRLAEACQTMVERTGYLTTLLGRRRRWHMWEPRMSWEQQQRARDEYGAAWLAPLADEAAARARWGRIRRAHTHKALNGLIQGSAADIMKKAMAMLWQSGLCAPEVLGVPPLTVHDELGLSSDPGRAARYMPEVDRILTTCVALKVPLLADGGQGANWREAKAA